MAKTIAKRRHDEAERAFRKAWKLLDRIERRLERARAEERKRVTQLGDGTGAGAPRRLAQLMAARAEIAQIEGLLTELSELITRNARASSGQTVKDMAHSVAAEIKDEAAEPPQLPPRRRNRHHRPRRKPASTDTTTDSADVAAGSDGSESSAGSDGTTPIALPPRLEPRTARTPSKAQSPSGPSRAPKPAPVVYRSLTSQPGRRAADEPVPDAGAPSQPTDASGPGEPPEEAGEPTEAGPPSEAGSPAEAGGPSEAGPADDAQTSGDPATPFADRDDPPAEGA